MITILGSTGFIGSHLAAHLQREHIEHRTPWRNESLANQHLGHVIDCAGLTGDFRAHPLDAVEAHVTRVLDLMRNATFDSFLYLSSTRVYRHHRGDVAREDDPIDVHPDDPDDLYALSKLMGESLILGTTNGKVARLSNVDGVGISSTLIAELLESKRHGALELQTSLDSEKDYVAIEDVVTLLPKIALHGTQRIYNVASGNNLTHREVAEALGAQVIVRPNAPMVRFPRIDITRIRDEFAFTPSPLRFRTLS